MVRIFNGLVAAWILAGGAAFGAGEETRWALMVEPSFTDAKIRRTIADSGRTVLVVARVTPEGDLEPLTREQKRGIPVTFAQVERAARETASAVLRTLTPGYVRDPRGVIEYALLHSDNPLTASTVLAPEFGDVFAETLGPDLVVAIPNRFTVYVFSRHDTAYLAMVDEIVDAYLSSNYPVSREFFLLSGGKLRSLGVLQ